MTGTAELAGDLKAELLDIREDLRQRKINQLEAFHRLRAVQRARVCYLATVSSTGSLRTQRDRGSMASVQNLD